VADLAEAVLLGDPGGPALDGGAGDLDRTTADPADQVMVVPGRTAPVRHFAVTGPQRVDLAALSHRLQGPVDGGQPDPVAALAEQVVDLLRGTEIVQVGQDRVHRRPLPGAALRHGRGGVGFDHHRCPVPGQCSS
jgi:hypothetical protein